METALAISRAHTQEAEEEKAQIDTVFRCILDYCFTQQKVPLSLCLSVLCIRPPSLCPLPLFSPPPFPSPPFPACCESDMWAGDS
jgi:hypothetical protein